MNAHWHLLCASSQQKQIDPKPFPSISSLLRAASKNDIFAFYNFIFEYLVHTRAINSEPLLNSRPRAISLWHEQTAARPDGTSAHRDCHGPVTHWQADVRVRSLNIFKSQVECGHGSESVGPESGVARGSGGVIRSLISLPA
jgi:hypothetical protein